MSQESQVSQLPSTRLDVSPVEIADILYYIFRFTNPLELSSSIALVSQYWHKLIFNNKFLWCYYCDLLWKGKFFITAQAMHIKNSQPIDAFKMSYIDRERNVINLKELTSLKWQFKLKYNQEQLQHHADNIVFATFNRDGTLTHKFNRFMGREFRWTFVQGITKNNCFGLHRSSRFYGLDDFDINAKNSTNSNTQTCYGYEQYLKQQNTENDEDETLVSIGTKHRGLTQSRWVRINNFPPLCAFRNNDWGWILQNEHVIFSSS